MLDTTYHFSNKITSPFLNFSPKDVRKNSFLEERTNLTKSSRQTDEQAQKAAETPRMPRKKHTGYDSSLQVSACVLRWIHSMGSLPCVRQTACGEKRGPARGKEHINGKSDAERNKKAALRRAEAAVHAKGTAAADRPAAGGAAAGSEWHRKTAGSWAGPEQSRMRRWPPAARWW